MTTDPKLQKLLQAVEELRSYDFQSPADKRTAMLATRHVSDDLQLPFDKLLEMWGAASKDAAMKVLIDTNLFAKWQGAATPVQTLPQLAALSGIDESLLASLLKHLAAWHILHEEGPDTYSQTAFSLQLARPDVAAGVNLQFHALFSTFNKLPAYLQTTKYRRPDNVTSAPIGYALNFRGTFFDYMQINFQCGHDLDLTMRGYAAYRGDWVDVFPGELLIADAKPDQTLLVDIGGGLGHDLDKYLGRFPEASGRVVLQDQANVVAKTADKPGIQGMAHDFMTQQPIKGARAYYLHQIMHDWPEADCLRILAALKPALAADSRILINEMVVPPRGASLGNTTFDMIMLALFGAGERPEGVWRAMIAAAGLRIVKIWSSESAVESVIEVALP